MPQLSSAVVLQIALLLSAVPMQYLISKWSGSTAAQRYHSTTRLLRIFEEWKSSYLSSEAWTDWTNQQMSKIMTLVGLEQEDQEERRRTILEMMVFDNDKGFFGASKTVRSPRPPYVFLRVGEVVRWRRENMIGVVVSWDPEMRAPSEWVDKIYSSSEGIKAEKTPHYKVIFSGHGASSLFVSYIPQTQLERATGMELDIPTMDRYFSHFDGKRFIMKPWLKELFPEDEEEEP